VLCRVFTPVRFLLDVPVVLQQVLQAQFHLQYPVCSLQVYQLIFPLVVLHALILVTRQGPPLQTLLLPQVMSQVDRQPLCQPDVHHIYVACQ
jgi:hypothetical protein